MPFDGFGSDEDPYAHQTTHWKGMLADRIQRWREILQFQPHLKATIDFETKSACNLKKHGSWLYSKHPTTKAMCLAYKLPLSEGKPKLWHMAHPQHLIDQSPDPEDLFAFILAGGLVEAHNAFFERVIWMHQMVAKHGWPQIAHEQWRCSAAKASAASLPRALEAACQAQGLAIEKDMVGNRLMLKMCKPRKPRKAEKQALENELAPELERLDELTALIDNFGDGADIDEYVYIEKHIKERQASLNLLWHEEEDDIYRLWDYCISDVEAEEALSDVTKDLNTEELAIWQMDQWMNERGVRFDLELADKALRMAGEWRKRLNKELEVMTGVSAATKRQAVRDWLAVNENLDLPDTRADTLDHFIENEEMSGRAKRIIEIVKQVNRTSVRKYQAMLDRTDPMDGRARDLLMYHGAGTGRWTGKGIQVHNFPRGKTVNVWYIIKGKEYSKLDMDLLCDSILTEDVDWVQLFHGDVMEALSTALRGAIIPADGYDLMVADYSAIEARCVLWEAGAEAALEVFRQGGDIYCDMAEGIYGYPVNKKEHPNERQFGKQAILGLGYGMGYITFFLTCRKYNIKFPREQCLKIMGAKELAKYEAQVRKALDVDIHESDDPKKNRLARAQAKMTRRRLIEERENPDKITHELALMKYTVNVYRTRYPQVRQMWKDQEAAAIAALQTPGQRVTSGKTTWFVEDGFLYCELPSKRCLSYANGELKMIQTSWGEMRPAVRYMSVAKSTHWVRTATYGGKIVENITQAIARDVMCCAMLEAYRRSVIENKGINYLPIMSVHDELVCEVKKDEGSEQEFEELMSSILPWAQGCPITAEANRFGRYRK